MASPHVAGAAAVTWSVAHRETDRPVTPEDVRRYLRENAVVIEDGDNFLAAFSDCTEGGGLADRRCTGLEFSVTYPVEKKPTLAEVNRLNTEYRMAKAYVNDEGDPGVAVALNTGGAFTREHLEDGLEWWIGAMRTFEEDIGWN